MKPVWALLKPAFFAIGLAFLVSGCARIKFAYNNIDWFILPKLKSYSNFDANQQKMIESEFTAYMKWHRKTMLPQYAKTLRHMASMIERPVSMKPEIAKEIRLQIQRELEDTLKPFLAATARVLITMSEEQMEKLDKKFEDEDVRFRERYVKARQEKSLERRERNVLDLVEFFTGDLRKDQTEILKSAIAKFPKSSLAWIESRKQYRSELLLLLRAKSNAKVMESHLNKWFIDRVWLKSPELKQFSDELENGLDHFIYVFVKVMNDQQRRKCRNLIVDFAVQFEELSLEPT